MTVFLDTSAILAVLDADSQNHLQARSAWVDLHHRQDLLITTNYVLVETFALVQRRLGVDYLRRSS